MKWRDGKMEKRLFDKTEEMGKFTKRCLMSENVFGQTEDIDMVKKLWKKAKSVKEFTELVLDTELLVDTQGYWLLAKEQLSAERYNDLVKRYLDQNADKHYITYSDIGCVSIGNDSMRYNIPNNYGDGENDVYVFDRDFDIRGLNFETSIKGNNMNVYDYDCGGDILETLSGRYAVYTGVQMVAFVKWED